MRAVLLSKALSELSSSTGVVMRVILTIASLLIPKLFVSVACSSKCVSSCSSKEFETLIFPFFSSVKNGLFEKENSVIIPSPLSKRRFPIILPMAISLLIEILRSRKVGGVSIRLFKLIWRYLGSLKPTTFDACTMRCIKCCFS